MQKCPVCSHDIVTPNYCDYCAMFLSETHVFCESDKRSASVLLFFKE